MPVSTTATVTVSLPVVKSHAPGAWILVIPQRLGKLGSLGVAAIRYRWLGCAYRTSGRRSSAFSAAGTDVPGPSRTRTRPLSGRRSTTVASWSARTSARAEAVVEPAKRTRSSPGAYAGLRRVGRRHCARKGEQREGG